MPTDSIDHWEVRSSLSGSLTGGPNEIGFLNDPTTLVKTIPPAGPYTADDTSGQPLFYQVQGVTTLGQRIFLDAVSLGASGMLKWLKELDGAPGTTAVQALAVVGAEGGSFIIAGSFLGAMTLASGVTYGPTQGTSPGFFIAKYSSSRSLLWSRGGTASGQTGVPTIVVAVDSSNNVILAGNFAGTADFGNPPSDPHPMTAIGNSDTFVVKYSSSGAWMWARQFGGSSAGCAAKGLAVDADSNIIVGGSHNNAMDCGSGHVLGTLGDGYHGFVFKLSSDGNTTTWATDAGATTGGTGITAVAVDTDSGRSVVAVGLIGGIFQAKYSGVNGSTTWSHVYGDTGSAGAFGVCIDPGHNSYLTGGFVSSVNMGEVSNVHNVSTIFGTGGLFVSAYTSAGACIWAMGFGAGGDIGRGIIVDSTNLYFTGKSFAGADFMNTGNYRAGAGYYIVKYSNLSNNPPTGKWWYRTPGSGAAQQVSPASGMSVGLDSIGNLLVGGSFNNAGVHFDSNGDNFSPTGITGNGPSPPFTDGFILGFSK